MKADYFLNRYYFRPIAKKIVPLVAKVPITPNQVTIIAFLIGLFSCYFFVKNFFLLGAIFIHLQLISDVTDGELARYKHISTEFGAKLDATLDIIWWFLLFGSLTLGGGIDSMLLFAVWITIGLHLVITRIIFPSIAANKPRRRWFNKWFWDRNLRFGFDEVFILMLISIFAPLKLISILFWIVILGRNFDWIYRFIEKES